nr:hypothetical protein [Tanacetum cinerariifolium]
MVCYQMDTEEVSDRFVAPCFVNGLEAYDGEINLGVEENMILNEYAVKLCFEHEVKRGSKVVKKELIVALKCEIYFVKFIINLKEDDVKHGVIFGRSFLSMTKAITNFEARTLDGKIVKEEEDAVKRIKGEALKEKDEPGAFVFPIRLKGEDMKKVDRGITMINHTQTEAMGILSNVLCQVGVTTLIAKILILDIPIDHDSSIVVGQGFLHTIGGIINIPERLFLTFDGFCHQTFCAARSDIMRNAKSDSDDEEDYQIKRNKFRAPIYGTKPAPYLNCNNPDERSLALQTEVCRTLGKCVALITPEYYGTHDDEAESSRSKRLRQNETIEEVLVPQVHHKDAKSRIGCYGEIDDMIRIRLREAGSDEEIFTFVAWIRAFNINKPIYAELCHDFYSTYEFDEVCVDDELHTKNIIKFRLGRRAYNLTLLEFARRLGLYQAVELEEEGFNVYFEGGLRNDEHFNAQDYWLSISREKNLGLSRSHTSTIRNPILRVIHKMITYGLCQKTTGYDKIQKNDLWLLSMFDARHQNGYANVAWVIAGWMKKKGAGTQKESQTCCGQFILKIARKCMVLTEDVVRSLSALIYCRDLYTITFRDLIDSDGKLIPEDPQSGVPRVGISRPPRASM